MDNIIIEGPGSNYLMPSFRLFLFHFWPKLPQLLNVTFTSVTEHCSILSFIDFCFVSFLQGVGGGGRDKAKHVDIKDQRGCIKAVLVHFVFMPITCP